MTMTTVYKAIVTIALVLFLGLGAAAPASAGALEKEKAAGLVGEQVNGYLGIVSAKAPAGLKRLVDEINLKRKTHYRGVAKKQGTSLQAVEAVAGGKLVKRASKGQYVRGANGRWIRK